MAEIITIAILFVLEVVYVGLIVYQVHRRRGR